MSHETLLQNYPPLFGELVPGVQLVKRRAMMNRTIVSEELKKGGRLGPGCIMNYMRPDPNLARFRSAAIFAPFFILHHLTTFGTGSFSIRPKFTDISKYLF